MILFSMTRILGLSFAYYPRLPKRKLKDLGGLVQELSRSGSVHKHQHTFGGTRELSIQLKKDGTSKIRKKRKTTKKKAGELVDDDPEFEFKALQDGKKQSGASQVKNVTYNVDRLAEFEMEFDDG